MNIESRTERVIQRLDELAAVSDQPDCICRFFGTEAHVRSRSLLEKWMTEAGMDVRCDNVGNVRGTRKSSQPNAKHFVFASHYDSVFDAGKYDGPLGVILGLEIAQQLHDQGIDLPFHLDVAAFADEEGGRFNTAYLGSCVLAGNFDRSWLERCDDDGNSLKAVIEGCGGNVDLIDQDQIPAEDWLGYFEVHIEQGPVLCNEDRPVCLVTGIAAQTRLDIKWDGTAGHAGTAPMHLRQDALCAAAEFTLAVESLGLKYKDELVATVGKLSVSPNTSNVIPGFVAHTLDIRSQNDAFLAERVAQLKGMAEDIAAIRNVKLEWQLMQSNASVACDAQLTDVVRKGIDNSGHGPCLEIPSGAGHDGVMISKVAPISMLFVRCTDGISHNPAEHVEKADIQASIEVCDQVLQELINSSFFNS